jgi:hypothetical protein
VSLGGAEIEGPRMSGSPPSSQQCDVDVTTTSGAHHTLALSHAPVPPMEGTPRFPGAPAFCSAVHVHVCEGGTLIVVQEEAHVLGVVSVPLSLAVYRAPTYARWSTRNMLARDYAPPRFSTLLGVAGSLLAILAMLQLRPRRERDAAARIEPYRTATQPNDAEAPKARGIGALAALAFMLAAPLAVSLAAQLSAR